MIRKNLEIIQERIAGAARAVGRDPGEVKLVVVTKGHPLEAIQEAIAGGAAILGENYVEEAVEKIKACMGEDVKWHMIGHVQSRKARPVCEYFDWLHSLDGLKLARRLDNFAFELGRKLPVLLECNVSGEESKFGFPAWQVETWKDLLADISGIVSLPNLQVCGLMLMAPYLLDPEQARIYFQRLRQLQEFLRKNTPKLEWNELSMGMSADFEIAIQEGATLVRIGTAIMGPRPG